MEDKRNRNARRSERMIRDAFITIVEREGADALSVSALCREADINRSTFYAHYDNLDELRSALGVMLVEGAMGPIVQALHAQSAHEVRDSVAGIGRVYEQNRPLYLAVTRANPTANGMAFRDRLDQGEPTNLARTVTGDFLLSAIMATYHTWAVGVYGDASIDEVNDQIAVLVSRALGLLS